jgi:methylated-DNA-[protein]-cysteine S-methyltransferase
MPDLRRCTLDTPLGILLIGEDDCGITSIRFTGAHIERPDDGKYLKQAVSQLREYFAGIRKDFDLPLSLHGTEFRKKVWNELRKIPYGETCSYQDIAGRINSPKACRAVGMANHHNPVVIVIPCHRVIGKNGSLTGYAEGIERKAQLLQFEKGNSK